MLSCNFPPAACADNAASICRYLRFGSLESDGNMLSFVLAAAFSIFPFVAQAADVTLEPGMVEGMLYVSISGGHLDF